MSDSIIIRLRCDSRESYTLWAIANSLIDEEGLGAPGVAIVELGEIPNTTGYHVDMKIDSVNSYERDAWERRGREPPEMSEDAWERINRTGMEDHEGVERIYPETPFHEWA